MGIVMIHVENPVLSQTGAALEMTREGFGHYSSCSMNHGSSA